MTFLSSFNHRNRTTTVLRTILAAWCLSAIVSLAATMPLFAQGRYQQVLTQTTNTFRDRNGTDRNRPYANNLNAFWLIQPANPLGTKLIVVRFDSLNTQRGRDVVRIFSGGSSQRLDTSKLVATFSGATLPPALIIPSTSAVTVQFITDGSIAGETRRDSTTGWTISYSSFTDYSTATVGAFSDLPDSIRLNPIDSIRNQAYPDDLTALWLIRPPGAQQILVQFDSLNIEDEFDFVSIIAGVEEPRIVAQYTGATLPPSLVVNDSIVVVLFTTDSSLAGEDDRFAPGWRLHFVSATRATVIRPEADRIDCGVVNLGDDAPLQTLRLSGSSFLDDIVAIAPDGFKISTSATGLFSDTVRIVTPKSSSSTVRGQIFIRFSPKTSGDFSGRLVMRSGSTEEFTTLVGLSKPTIYWESTGGPNSGQVTALAVAAGNVLLAGTRSGIYRSNSNGAVWQQSNNGLLAKGSLNIRFISIGQGTDTLVYISTDAGLFFSADTGKKWTLLPTLGIPNQSKIFSLLQYAGRLLAGTSAGLYQYSRANRRWTLAMEGFIDKKSQVRSLAAHGNNIVAGTLDYGVYISSDSSATWRPINGTKGGTGELIPTQDSSTVAGLVSVGDGQLVAIVNTLYEDDNGDEQIDYSDIYRTNDNGKTWIQENLDSLDARSVYLIYNAVIANGVFYLATDGGVARRRFTDDAPWNLPADPTKVGFTEPTVQALVTNGSTIYAGTLGGVFRSSNQGLTWQPVNTGLTATRVNSLTTARGVVFAATDGSGVFRSADNGASWQSANNGLRGVYVNDFAELGDALYACTYNDRSEKQEKNGVYRSFDNGLTWNLTTPFPESNKRNAPALDPQPDVWTMTVDDKNIMYVGASVFEDGYLYASTTNGVSWQVLDSLPGAALSSPIFAIEDGPGPSLFIGTYGEGVFYSPNPLATASDNWSRILFDNDSGNEYYVWCLATFRDNIFVGTENGLYRLNAARTRWLPIPTTLNAPKQITRGTILALHESGGMLYAGTYQGGVWRSPDGLRWERADSINTLTDVYALTDDGFNMYAGLDGDAIYRSSLTQPTTAARAFVEVDDYYRAKPGDTIEIAIRLGAPRRNLPTLAPAQMPSFSGVLRFNASLLEPVDEDTRLQSVVSNGERLVNFRAQLKSDPQIRLTRDSVVKRFRFRALLGNSVATPLALTNLSAQDISMLTRRPGLFTLTGLSDAGGTRLFVAESKPLVAVQPNPAASNFTISVKTFEAGETTVSISNIFGQTVKTLISAELVSGDYHFNAELANMPQGVYFVTVQTPTQRVVRQVQMVK